MMTVLACLISAVVAAVITWLITKLLTARSAAATHAEHIKSTSMLQAEMEAQRLLLREQKAFVDTARAQMEQQFRLIAGSSLDENSRRMAEQQQSKLQDTLQPFREQIEAFRKQVDEKFTAEVADRASLRGELTKVFSLTSSLGEQAERLTRALSSQTKTQGDFGEDILETILRNAGMVEGEHFERQYSTVNEDGVRVIPDIILNCPGGYRIVVDAKVSLTAYLRYCNEQLTPEEERGLRRDIWTSFKAHIDGLSIRKYESIAGVADFVLMFTPVESAFSVAAQHDADIRQYAFRKKVFLVTPSNLLLVVRMIGDLWQKDRVSREARDMADRAKKLYEKACNFLQSFQAVGEQLQRAQEEFSRAGSQLSGHGGLVRQGEMLQELLGTATQKTIPEKLAQQSALAQGLPVEKTEA